jgi:acyl carrier protein
MTTTMIRAKVLAILGELAPETDPGTLDPERPLRDQLDLDSFDYLQLMVRLHEELGVEIPERDYADLRTLAELVRYLETRVAPSGSAG